MEETTERESANETSSVGDLQPASDVDHHPENHVPPLVNHKVTDSRCKISDKEITGIIEVIAATGRFWHDWDTLKSLLSCRLKQVLAEYPESQIAAGPESRQSFLSGKIYTELVKRLDEELLSFIEGPPFTLQRLCEILLTARHIYPKLSKLALALEKNLLVTSTLSMSTDPYPGAVAENRPQDSQQTVHGVGDEHIQNQSDPVQNGVSGGEGDADQEMAEAEANEDNVNSDVEMKEDNISEESESSSERNTDSNPSTEPSTDTEHITSIDKQE